MKKLLAVLLALSMLFAFAACGGTSTTDGNVTPDEVTVGDATAGDAEKNMTIRLSTTTSVDNSGLLAYLLPAFEAKTGYKFEVTSEGTGMAIQFAKDGNADLILVHSKAQEEAFVNDGYGVERIPFMYNYFVVVGPADDPAGIADCATAAEAFAKIAEAEEVFVSRGDKSGTHNAELKLWGENVPDAETATWYQSAGTGMGATLRIASEQGGYCLTDKATFLANKDSLDLEIIMAESEDMKNTYSVIECNPEKLDGVNTEASKAFIEWLTGDEASALIAEFGEAEYGEALFFLLEE
ncbi:MAG: substrate-binding domain-containing protein [Clostridia bacterium]|nr:substrate-binding domain-containing protein [Clostridia bacterium]